MSRRTLPGSIAPGNSERVQNQGIPVSQSARIVDDCIGVLHLGIANHTPVFMIHNSQAVFAGRGYVGPALAMDEVGIAHKFSPPLSARRAHVLDGRGRGGVNVSGAIFIGIP